MTLHLVVTMIPAGGTPACIVTESCHSLSTGDFRARRISKDYKDNEERQNTLSLYCPIRKVSIASFTPQATRFGLDSKVVILISVPPHKNLAADCVHFSRSIAVSRARQLLTIIDSS
jgi:hypothetical protein